MSDFTVYILSERFLFRKTFSKLIGLLDTKALCREEAVTYDTIKEIPAPNEGAVVIDCGNIDAQSVDACMFHCLSIQPTAMIILVFDEQNDAVIEAAMSLGAMGVIIKATTPNNIIDSLQRVLMGERCRPAPVFDVPREHIPEHLRRQLSARQQKMLRAMIGGQSISVTAGKLGVTPAKLVNDMREVIAKLRGH